ncbi:MAG: AraC family transcriptional regulator, partial [Acidobacteriota bacterium]
MRILLLAVDGVFDTGLSLLLDTFATANELLNCPERGPHFQVQVVGVRDRVRTQQGFVAPAVVAAGVAPPDLVVVPALGEKTPATLASALQRPDVKDAAQLLV